MPPRILVTQAVPQEALDMLRAAGAVEMPAEPSRAPTPEELRALVARNDYLYCLITDRIDAAALDANPNLKIVANVGVGYNNIDLAAATARRIPVSNTPDVLTDTTADLAFALLMAVARRLVAADRYLRSGQWPGWAMDQWLGQDIHHATLGLIGFGRIGQQMARRAQGFDMRVLYHDAVRAAPEVEARFDASYVDLDTLLAEADFVSLHTPYMPSTHHLIGAAQLARMKPTASIFNTARGPIIDEQALVDALQAGQIAGAGLDVYEQEPKVNPGLLALDNVVLLPHIGSASHATRRRMATLAAENVLAVINGQRPPTCVNPEIYG